MKSFAFTEAETLISPEQLLRQLAEKMDALWKAQPKAGNAEWTRQVKQFLADIGSELENPAEKLTVEVLYTNAKPDVHEFLLDVVWWCRVGKDPKREFMALAAEIEWASWAPSSNSGTKSWADHLTNCVGEDFGKLTVVKSPLKLMVFCTDKSGPERSHVPMQRVVLEEIDRYLRSYAHHIPGESYIFLDVASDGHRQAWMRSVDKNGVLSPFQKVS